MAYSIHTPNGYHIGARTIGKYVVHPKSIVRLSTSASQVQTAHSHASRFKCIFLN